MTTNPDTRDLLATIAGLRQQLERVTQERDELVRRELKRESATAQAGPANEARLHPCPAG